MPGPFGGPRPFAEDECDVVLDQDIDIKGNEDPFVEDPLAASEGLATFLEALNNQQPEADVATAEILFVEGYDYYHKLIIPMSKPVIIFSHIEDAGRTMEMKADDRLELSDGGVKPRGLARDQVDKMMDNGELLSSFGAQTIL